SPGSQPPALTILQKTAPGDEVHARPLERGLIRRLLGYTRPMAARRNWLIFFTVSRSIQLPLLAWSVGVIISGPIARADHAGLLQAAAGVGRRALGTESMCHFRQRYPEELGRAVVSRLRHEVFERVQRQPMGLFNRTKLGRISGRMTSDLEALRAGIQDVF